MSKSVFWKKATPAVLSAAVVLTGVPVTAFAAAEEAAAEGDIVVVEEVDLGNSAEEQVSAGEYVYGTANLSYADFFYGELHDVAVDAQMQLDKSDPVTQAGYRDTGMYDAVTSATNSKCKRYATSYFEDLEDGGVSLNGVKEVNVAVPVSLYEEAVNAIAENRPCANQLLSIIGSLQNVTDTAPQEYKILNGDGTLGAMVTETKVLNLETSITTGTAWGNYQVSVEFGDANADKPTIDNMMGVIFETSDGQRYGMIHSENLWLQTNEIAFAVEDGFVEPHGNTIEYQRHADLPGKTITKITYLVKDGADIVIDNTNLLCKYLLADDQTISGTEETVVYADGAKVQMTRKVPAGSNYALESVTYGGQVLTEGTDYTYENDILTVKKTEHTGVGSYTLEYTDASYEDISTSVVFDSGLKDGDVKIENNKLSVNSEAYTIADYLAAVTGVTVDGVAQGGRKISMETVTSAIFAADGTVQFDAQINGQAVFAKEEGSSYELELSAAGFPKVTASVRKAADTSALEQAITSAKALKEANYSSASWEQLQKILADCEAALENPGTQAAVDEQTAKLQTAVKSLKASTFKLSATSGTLYTKGTVSLKVTTNLTGTVTWKSSNTKVASVSSKGVVTAKAAGTATITASLKGKTASYKVTVKNPGITAKAAQSTIYTKGTTSTTVKVTKYGVTGTAKFKSSNTKIATVNSKGVVTAKKAGTVKITAQVGSYTKVVTIQVKNPSLKLSKTSATIKKGATTTIKATATPSGKITYTSSNKKVATVTTKGVVKGVAKGTAKITVTCNGVKKTFTVTVK